AEGGTAEAPAPDSISLLSLQTVASDLQKCDSVGHLLGLCDASSLHCQLREAAGTTGASASRAGLGLQGGCRHHRNVSL
ncbi:3BP5L protein, partial [Eubucco bourcierii]|nr:3BP5L protein [Eubucco bourcierii]